MECNCKNNCDGSSQDVPRIKHVQGNVLRLAIPLTLRTIEQDGGEMVSSDTDFIPSSEVPVRVVFSKGAVNVPIDATMKNGNIAYVEDKGTIPVGTYNITITCSDDSGNPYRFKQNTVLQVVDTTAEAGITTPIEYEVRTWYLESAIYLALEGKGIEDIITESSDEAGGFNYVTILLTDGTSRTFSVMNGSGLPDTELDVNSLSPIANKAVSMKFAEIENKLTSIIGDVDYDSTEKSIRFWDKEKTEVLMALDARPFIKDGMVNNVYISNNMLVVTFNTDAGREAIGIPLSMIFNPSNYYDKAQVDGKVNQLSSLFANYYNRTQVDRMISEVMSQQTYIRMDSDSVPPVFFDISGNQMQHADVIALFNDPSKNVVLHCEFEYEDKVCPCNLSLASIEDEGQYKMYYFEGSRIASLGLCFVASLFSADGTLYVSSWNVVQGGGEEGFSGDYNDLINKPTIPTSLSQMSGDSTHRTVTDAEKASWNAKANRADLAEVATSGSYNDLEDKPTIPAEQVQSDWNQTDTTAKDYIKNKPAIPSSVVVEQEINENSENAVAGGPVYAALEGKAPKPKNTVYVDLDYWQSHKNKIGEEPGVFGKADTHYILTYDFYDYVESFSVQVQKFAPGCVLSANKGCRFGAKMKIQFNDTYIDVGQQQLFKPIVYEHPAAYERTIVEYGTMIYGTFANSRILVEWWGAKGGRGVRGTDGTFENAATERQALNNAIAFNSALICAGQSEVYAPAPVYMIGASIIDTSMPMLRDGIAKDSDGQNKAGCSSFVTSYTKLFVEGDLVASNEFIGARRNCGTAYGEIPAVVYLGGNLPRCVIKGAVVVPFSAQDKNLSIVSSLPSSPVVGTMYFISKTSVSAGTDRLFDVYDTYYHYTSDTTNDKEVRTRKVGEYYTSSSKITNFVSASNLFGGVNRNYTKSGSTKYLKITGMYGVSVSAIGGYVEIGRILKGDHRGGYWNITQDKKLMSYRYRKEMMHQGHCTAMGMRCVKSSTIKVGQIEGFDNGVAFDGTYSPDYDAVEFNHFEFGSIACNYAVHLMCGSAYACLVNSSKSTQKYFDGCRWLLGGFEPISAGSNGFDVFCPTTSKSTYFLVENDAGTGDGFSNHWVEFDNSPLRWYTSIVDIARANDNQFLMHGNTSGDTGRIVLWTTKNGIISYDKYRVYRDRVDEEGNAVINPETNKPYQDLYYKLPKEFNGGNEYIKAGEDDTDDKVANCFQLADGETLADAQFPIDSFAGFESLYGNKPYAYAHLAALSNNGSLWETKTGYPVGSRLAPYVNGQLLYDEWSCPFSATRSFINFREGSHVNVVRSGRKHMLCYESVYCDGESGRNEIRHAQSAYAMYDDTAHKTYGHWTVINAYHPVYDIVRYDFNNDPRDYGDNTDISDANNLEATLRRTFVPDENTLSCLQVVDTDADISAAGLYIVKAGSSISVTSSAYKQVRYQLWEKFSSTKRQVGWISSIFLKLVEGGGSGGTVTETDPTVPTYVKAITQANIAAWNAKAERVVLNMTVSHDVPSFTTQDGATFTEAEFRALVEDNSKEIVVVRNSSDYYINTYRDSEECLMFVGHNGGRSFKVFYIGLDDEELYHEEHDIDVPFFLSELSQDSTHRTVTDTEKSAWNAKVNSSDLAEVATSGDYDDLINKPTIPTVPTNVSSFTNDAGYLTSHQDISGKADKVTIVEVSDTGSVSQALDPNKFYKFTGALTSLSLTLVSGTGFVMYAGKFTTGSGWGSNGLTIPATVTEAANNDEIAASKTYEFSIMDNVIVIKEV